MRIEVLGWIPLWAALTAAVPPAAAVRRIAVPAPGPVAVAGDVNGDGVPDILKGMPYLSVGPLSEAGEARVYSGADGALLYAFQGSAAAAHLGAAVAGAGDVNGDGRADVIVGAPGNLAGNPPFVGYARAFSGADGSTLFTLTADAADDGFGGAVAGLGDLTDDGRSDVAVYARPYIRVFSGATGGALYTETTTFRNDCLAALGDVDGDAKKDFASCVTGYVVVFSGATGALLRAVATEATVVGAAGDLDGDAVPDFVAGDVGYSVAGARGAVAAFSTNAEALLWRRTGGPSTTVISLGTTVGSVGDLDGDGVGDVAAEVRTTSAGRVNVYSGATGAPISGYIGGDGFDSQASDSMGDRNGDGTPDFLVGVNNINLLGSSSADIVSGRALQNCPDLDGDGWSGVGGICNPAGIPDCSDSDARVFPGGEEIPFNGIDDDCNPLTPGGCPPDPQMTVPVAGYGAHNNLGTAGALALYAAPAAAILLLRRRRR